MSSSTEASATVLVVDDEWVNRELMEAVLQSAGYAVLLANSARQALQLAAEHAPDLALVDVRLHPDADGYKLCRELKALPQQPEILVVMMTALDTDDARSRAMSAGADDFMGRMTDMPRFLKRIAALLKSREG